MKSISIILLCQLAFAQIEAESYKNYLQKIDIKNSSQFSKLHIIEIKSYLDLFPKEAKNAELIKSLADYYYSLRNYHEALFYYLKTRILYSNYERVFVDEKINTIILNHEKSDYNNSADRIIFALNDTSTHHLLDDQFRFISLLFEINEAKHSQHVIYEAKLFIKLFPHSINTDRALIIIAKSYERLSEENRALFYYELLEELVPSSDQLSFVYFQKANIFAEYLGDHKKAIEMFTTLLSKDSTYELSHEAQFRIAKLYEEELDNTALAIEAYENYLSKYAGSSFAVASLMRIAKIHDTKLDFDKTIKSYKRLVDNYTNHPDALFAQNQIVEILIDELANYDAAASELMRYAELFPTNVKKDEYYLEGIELIDEKLKDPARVQKLCESFLEKFPNSPFIDDVRELMSEK